MSMLPPPKNPLNSSIPEAVLPSACREQGCVFSIEHVEVMSYRKEGAVAIRHDGMNRTLLIVISQEEIDDPTIDMWKDIRLLLERLHGAEETHGAAEAGPEDQGTVPARS